MKPKVSIIVPVYNVEPFLSKCLDSIMAQTFTDFEAVLVDDGSTDNSGLICDEYAANDSRFVVVHKQNEGVAKARFTAFEHSRGELITFIDADDHVAPQYLEKLSRPIFEDGADMVSCDYVEIENNKTKERPGKLTGVYDKQGISLFLARHYFYDSTCKGFGMTHFLWAKMIKREYVEEGLRNGIGLWVGEDQVSLFTMLTNINKMHLISDRLYFYVQHSGQTIRKYDYSLWLSVITMFERYQEILNHKNIDTNGLYIRTWINLKYTIKHKMLPLGIGQHMFIDHISKVRNTPYMRDFFRQKTIPFGFKDNVKFWLLKMKWYRISYMVFSRY